jgi:outer membrane beta-barrel protein
MDNGIQRIFLTVFISTVMYLSSAQLMAAEEPVNEPNKIYNPELERQVIDEALIDDEDFELGLFFGVLGIEDFGASELYGFKAAYHINEDFFINLNYAQAKAGLTSDEELFGIIRFTDDERQYQYYDFSIGWNLLPGEGFVWKDYALNTSFYLIAGVGNTEFAGNTEFTYIVGAGYKILYNDWMAVNLDTRDHMFNAELTGSPKRTHNLEFSLGISFYF